MSKLFQVAEIVCNYYDVNIEGMFKKGKHGNVIKAKQIISFIAYKYMGYDYLSIGKFFKLNEHTTILARVKTIQECLNCKDYVYEDVVAILGKASEILARNDGKTCIMINIPNTINHHEVIKHINSRFDVSYMFVDDVETTQKELKSPVVRMETLSPADEVRRKYL